MSFRRLHPQSIHPPFAHYANGVEVSASARLVFCSGQLGIAPDAHIPEDAGAQAELCFEAIAAILGEAGMMLADVVRLNAYVTAREYLAPYMAVRDRYMGVALPASTLMIVTGFAREVFKVEVEAVAGRAVEPESGAA
jgi:enamine deaminase RidA (YjgF/YER057c/UK114 family)